MFFLGSLALIQIAVLPGILILKLMNFKGGFLQRMLYMFALSLIGSYCIVFILTAVHLYNHWSILLVFILEAIASIWLYWKDLQTPITSTLQQAADSLIDFIHSILPDREGHESGERAFYLLDIALLFVFIGLAINSILRISILFVQNLGTVFSAWDALVSWNRWALTWAAGQIPLDSAFYPQLVPAIWSVTYTFMGNTTIQFFAKGIMPLFALSILIAMFDLARGKSALGAFIAVTITELLIERFLSPQITNGHVDIAVAFLAFMPIYSILKAREIKDDENLRQKNLLLGLIFAAGAGVTKQAGMYMFLIYPILVYINIIHPARANMNFQVWKKYLTIFLLIALIPLSWYVLKEIVFMLGRDVPETSSLIEISSQAYDNAGLATQIISSFGRFGGYLWLFVAVLLGLFLLDSLYAGLTLLLLIPYPFIWAWLAAYDTRNLSIFVPIFGLTSGMALQEIYRVLQRLILRIKLTPRVYVYPLLILLIMIAGGFVFPQARLINRQVALQKQIFSPSKNQKIYDLIATEGKDTKILTNYPISLLPGLESNQVHFTFKDYSRFLEYTQDPSIRFMLVPNDIDDNVKAYIDNQVADGNYVVLFVDKEWVTYRMIQIIRR